MTQKTIEINLRIFDTGASIATLITEFLVMVYGIHWIDRELVHKNLYKEIISPLVGVCIISAFMLISRNYANVAPLSIISVLIFTAILYNTGWVGSEEIALLKRFFRKETDN